MYPLCSKQEIGERQIVESSGLVQGPVIAYITHWKFLFAPGLAPTQPDRLKRVDPARRFPEPCPAASIQPYLV